MPFMMSRWNIETNILSIRNTKKLYQEALENKIDCILVRQKLCENFVPPQRCEKSFTNSLNVSIEA